MSDAGIPSEAFSPRPDLVPFEPVALPEQLDPEQTARLLAAFKEINKRTADAHGGVDPFPMFAISEALGDGREPTEDEAAAFRDSKVVFGRFLGLEEAIRIIDLALSPPTDVS